jgi:hypothetical protein
VLKDPQTDFTFTFKTGQNVGRFTSKHKHVYDNMSLNFRFKLLRKLKYFLSSYDFFKILSFTDKCDKYGSFEMSMNDRRLNWRKESRYSSVSIVPRPRAERSGVRFQSVTIFSLLHIARNGSGTYPRPCSMGKRVLHRGHSDRGVLLITGYLCRTPRLRISGAIPLLPLHVKMVWILKKLPLHRIMIKKTPCFRPGVTLRYKCIWHDGQPRQK